MFERDEHFVPHLGQYEERAVGAHEAQPSMTIDRRRPDASSTPSTRTASPLRCACKLAPDSSTKTTTNAAIDSFHMGVTPFTVMLRACVAARQILLA
jgi:hypothetical protein